MPILLLNSLRDNQGPQATAEDAGEGIDGLHLDLEAEYCSSENAEPSSDMDPEAPKLCIVLPDFSWHQIKGHQDVISHRYPD